MLYNKPYTKDSGIEITKDEPYLTRLGRRWRKGPKNRHRPAKGYQYEQLITEYDPIRHKNILKKRIIHSIKKSWE